MEIDFVKSEEYKQFERTIKLIFRCFRRNPLKYIIQAILIYLSFVLIIGVFPV